MFRVLAFIGKVKLAFYLLVLLAVIFIISRLM